MDVKFQEHKDAWWHWTYKSGQDILRQIKRCGWRDGLTKCRYDEWCDDCVNDEEFVGYIKHNRIFLAGGAVTSASGGGMPTSIPNGYFDTYLDGHAVIQRQQETAFFQWMSNCSQHF